MPHRYNTGGETAAAGSDVPMWLASGIGAYPVPRQPGLSIAYGGCDRSVFFIMTIPMTEAVGQLSRRHPVIAARTSTDMLRSRWESGLLRDGKDEITMDVSGHALRREGVTWQSMRRNRNYRTATTTGRHFDAYACMSGPQ